MSEEAIAKEQKTATTILKQIKYEELLKVKGKSGLLRVLCKGDIEKNLIDEILVYSKMPVKESAVGFVLVRAIADEFPLDKIPMLINYIKNIDTNNADLQFMIDI